MDDRLNQLHQWLERKYTNYSLSVASADASFRRYFRLHANEGCYIVMDSPPDREPVADFLKFSYLFKDAGVAVPAIICADEAHGFIVLQDFGDTTLFDALRASSKAEVLNHYRDAINGLVKLQQTDHIASNVSVGAYSNSLLRSEMQLLPEWFLQRHLGLALSTQQQGILSHAFQWIAEACTQQHQCMVHRDYHSRNLMILANTKDDPIGVIDYQDAVIGPHSYDLASLLKDCYYALPSDWQDELIGHYIAERLKLIPDADFSAAQFVHDYHIMGVQRHLKVLGIFCRLNYRDNKSNYMHDLALVMSYLLDALKRFEQLHELHALLADVIITEKVAPIELPQHTPYYRQ